MWNIYMYIHIIYNLNLKIHKIIKKIREHTNHSIKTNWYLSPVYVGLLNASKPTGKERGHFTGWSDWIWLLREIGFLWHKVGKENVWNADLLGYFLEFLCSLKLFHYLLYHEIYRVLVLRRDSLKTDPESDKKRLNIS